MTDPYTTLGVPRTASADEIRRAYRERALALHPDRGGDPSAFQSATEAHDCLSDPERRARYDATGDMGGHRPQPSPHAEVIAVLVPCMEKALQEMYNQGHKADDGNLVQFMKRVLDTRLAEHKRSLDNLEKVRAAFSLASERFKEPGDVEPLLVVAARHHLNGIDGEIARTAAEQAQMKRAQEYLAKCDYTFTARFRGFVGHSPYGAPSTTATNGFWGIS